MQNLQAIFEISSPDLKRCPDPWLPEYAFIGRSNVGKSSLINALVNQKNLAKTSGRPGKTQLINFFNVSAKWFLVDLPGYGYAKVSKKAREKFQANITNYISKRDSLINTFVLLDIRLEPQTIDLEFMEWLGNKEIPFSIVFTKSDKLSKSQINRSVDIYKSTLKKSWEELPEIFVTSAKTNVGRLEILNFIDDLNTSTASLMQEAIKSKKAVDPISPE
jgi:GTP-binding protein